MPGSLGFSVLSNLAQSEAFWVVFECLNLLSSFYLL